MNSPRLSQAVSRGRTRASSACRNEAGAFGLPSIIVGVVVVGILTAGVLAAIFGVIPFAQDRAAQQDLAAIRTAQGTSKAQEGVYLAKGELEAAGVVNGMGAGITVTSPDGTGWCATAVSGSGKIFSVSNRLSAIAASDTCAESILDPEGDGAQDGAEDSFDPGDPWVIEDPRVLSTVRGSMGLFSSEELTMGDAANLSNLWIQGPVTSLEGLQYATNLRTISINGASGTAPLSDLSPLEGMSLESLKLISTSVGDLTPLTGMHSLQELSVQLSKVDDLDPLRGMAGLTWLDISDTQVTTVAPLADVPNLETLRAYSTDVTDWSAVDHVASLEPGHLR